MIGTRTIQIAVMVLALVALVAPVVHAGGAGQGGLGDTFMFNCYLIDGFKPPHVLTVDDQFFPVPDDVRTGVNLGKAKLLCTPAGAIVTSEHEVRTGLSAADHMKCYDSPPSGANPGVDVQVVDPFGEETVTVGVPKFICVGAVKCPVGETCPPE